MKFCFLIEVRITGNKGQDEGGDSGNPITSHGWRSLGFT